MIINFKIFEDISRPMKVGDYALITMRSKGKIYDSIFKIGKITGEGISVINDKLVSYIVQEYQIKYWSDSKEELERFLEMKNFNL